MAIATFAQQFHGDCLWAQISLFGSTTCEHDGKEIIPWSLHSSSNGSFLLNFPLAKAVVFDLTWFLVEIADFCSPNRELSNGVWLE